MSTVDLKKILKEINKEINHLSSANNEQCEKFKEAFENSCSSLKTLLKNNSDIIITELNNILNILIDKLHLLADTIDKGITNTVNALLIGIKNIVDNLLISIDRIHKEIDKIHTEISNIYIQIDKNNPYGCTSFPMYNPSTQTAPIPLAVASDSTGCYKIVKNPQSSRSIIKINEGTVWNDKVPRDVPALNDNNIYSVRGLADVLRPHQEVLSDGIKICRNIYSYADMPKLNKAKFFSSDFNTVGDKPDLSVTINVNVSARNNDYTKITNACYFIFVIDEIIELPNDGQLVTAIVGINNSLNISGLRTTSISGKHFDIIPGKHHIDGFLLPNINDFIPYSPRLWTPSGKGEFGEFYGSSLTLEYKSE